MTKENLVEAFFLNIKWSIFNFLPSKELFIKNTKIVTLLVKSHPSQNSKKKARIKASKKENQLFTSCNN